MNVKTKPADGGTQPSSDNMSIEEFISRREARLNEPETQPDALDTVPVADPAVVPVIGDPPGDETQPEFDDDDDDGAGDDEEEEEKIDLLALSPEEIRELAKRAKSRLLHRIGELTAKAHNLESQLTSIRESKPQALHVSTEDNPYRDLKSVEEVSAKHAEFLKVVEETDRILEDHEDYGPEDLIELEDGKEFTKKKIRQANRSARDALVKFLPARHADLLHEGQRKVLEDHCAKLIPVEVPELQDAESEVAKRHAAMMKDPLIEQVKQRVPDLAPQLSYLLAHAARSMTRLTRPTPAVGKQPPAKLPDTPFGAGAGGGRPKRADPGEQAYQEFEKTGSPEAWAAARAARLAART